MSKILDSIRLRCLRDEETGCMEWHGYLLQGTPTMRYHGKRMSVRQVVLRERGKWVEGRDAVATCSNPLCVEHVAAWTRSRTQKRAALTRNNAKSLKHRAALAKAARGRGRLTPEAVQAIRDGRVAPAQAPEVFGCCERTAYKVLAHQIWRDYEQPFSGLLAANDSQRARA